MNGWVKLHRGLLENVELINDPTARLLFVDLLLLANSKGQVGKSGRELAEYLKTNYSTMYKALKRLENYGQIQQMGKHSYTLIYICNWQKYQENGKHFGKQFTTGVKPDPGKQVGKHTVSTREAHGKQLTEVARIRIKNKKGDTPAFEGAGYRKAQKIAKALRQKTI